MDDWRSKTPQHEEGGLSPSVTLRVLAGLFTLQDVILFAYLAIMTVLVLRAPPGPKQDDCGRALYLSMATLVLGCFLARGPTDLPRAFRAALYRGAIVGVLISTYLMLRDLLALVRPDSVDDALVRVDLRLFGVEPALWLERYNHRPIVEWFSCFYFSYFFIDLFYLLAVVWWGKPGRRTAEFAIGTVLVFGIGQLGYTMVPGYGPILHLKGAFHSDLDGGFFWSCVYGTVQAGGAMKDIFPSLHTAVPLWFTFFARQQAKTDPRWRWPAWITAFFAINIIISTMLLRWHYGIDVLAGIGLAVTVGLVTPRLAALEESWRRSLGYGGPWCFPAAEERGSV